MKIHAVGLSIGYESFVAVIGLTLTISFAILAKYDPYFDPAEIEAAGQNWEEFHGNWATSLAPAHSNPPPPFVDPLPVWEWENTEALSNYLATVHVYQYQWSTNLVDWVGYLQFPSDDAYAPIIRDRILNESIAAQNYIGAQRVDCLFWRFVRVD